MENKQTCLKAYRASVWPWRGVILGIFVVILVLVVLIFLELSTTPSPEYVGRVVQLSPTIKSNQKKMKVLVQPFWKFQDLHYLRYPVFVVLLYDMQNKKWVCLDDEYCSKNTKNKRKSKNKSKFVLLPVWGNEDKVRLYCCEERKEKEEKEKEIISLVPCFLSDGQLHKKESAKVETQNLPVKQKLRLLTPKFADISKRWQEDDCVLKCVIK